MWVRFRCSFQRFGWSVLTNQRCLCSSGSEIQSPLNYVDGERINPTNRNEPERFDLFAPATGELLGHIVSSSPEDVDTAVKNSENAFKKWSSLSGSERGKVLLQTAHIIRDQAEELSHVEVLNTGKPIWEARVDILGCADAVEYYGGIAATIAGQHIQLPNGSFAYTRREPLGVVGAIGAWNYPFQMAAWKSAPALACGNTMVFKPSPLTPLTAIMLGEIYTQAGLPDGCFNVIQGQANTGTCLSQYPGINKMTFTGSVPTGSKVMEACAQGIKPVTLELGGKSPLIVFADCDVENAVNGAMLANFLTQGQVCSNGTRVFVEEPILDQFLTLLVEKTKKLKIGDPWSDDTAVGAMISREHAEKVLGYVQLAKSEGATVLYGGDRVTLKDPKFSEGYFLRPCILSGCHDNMRVVQEEIFGSVVSVLSFDCEDEVVKRANDTEFGLAGGVFTRDIQRAHRVAAQLQAGTIYINNYNVFPVEVPFGGYKKSGLGRENGTVTLDYYTQVKSVYVEMNKVVSPW
ncbi:4-trimethylaminobutyraldehyde dehydrogenase-like [Liolophura sinensis]|uniref:4-trimethylaminobutyraldehyde dehydrogenase-like n=1 Tax=Liolophura sinensis TaxID=3198878 RepID=UPI003158D88D